MIESQLSIEWFLKKKIIKEITKFKFGKNQSQKNESQKNEEWAAVVLDDHWRRKSTKIFQN